MSKPETLEYLYELRDEVIHSYRSRYHQKPAYVLVGMKSDLMSSNTRRQERMLLKLRRSANSFGCQYYELNPYATEKLDKMFQDVLEMVFENECKNERNENTAMTTQILGAGTTHSEAQHLHNSKKGSCIIT